jgi:hypothetical protein
MAWCKFYDEWAFDPKVQTMPESLQRRHAMLLCYHKAGMVPGLSDSEIAHGMRITLNEAQKTKSVFIAKGFIDETWKMLKWDKRQAGMSESRERVARYRERYRNATETLPQRDSNVTEISAPAREEKNREETPLKPPQGGKRKLSEFTPPDWIPPCWPEFLAMRARIKKPATPFAQKLVVAELAKLQAQGHDPAAVLEQSIRNGWQDVFPIRAQNGNYVNGPAKKEEPLTYFQAPKRDPKP